MHRLTATLPLLLLLAALSLGLAACGQTETGPTMQAETEGVYIQVGDLKYQVQTSRALNEFTPDDRSYLQGVKPSEARLAPDEEWFAIFLRVENGTKQTRPSAVDFQIRDSQANVYTPVIVDQTVDRNFFAYQSEMLPPQGVIPNPDSPAGERPPFGSVLLFKLRRFSIGNRPLELVVKSRQVPQTEGTVNLDV